MQHPRRVRLLFDNQLVFSGASPGRPQRPSDRGAKFVTITASGGGGGGSCFGSLTSFLSRICILLINYTSRGGEDESPRRGNKRSSSSSSSSRAMHQAKEARKLVVSYAMWSLWTSRLLAPVVAVSLFPVSLGGNSAGSLAKWCCSFGPHHHQDRKHLCFSLSGPVELFICLLSVVWGSWRCCKVGVVVVGASLWRPWPD